MLTLASPGSNVRGTVWGRVTPSSHSLSGFWLWTLDSLFNLLGLDFFICELEGPRGQHGSGVAARLGLRAALRAGGSESGLTITSLPGNRGLACRRSFKHRLADPTQRHVISGVDVTRVTVVPNISLKVEGDPEESTASAQPCGGPCVCICPVRAAVRKHVLLVPALA